MVIWDEFEEDEEDERGQVHREQQPDEEAEITAPAFLVQDNDSALLKEVKEPQKGGGGEDEAATATSTTSAKQEAPEFSINSAAATTNIPKNQEETEEKDAQQLSVDGPKSLLISELTWVNSTPTNQPRQLMFAHSSYSKNYVIPCLFSGLVIETLNSLAKWLDPGIV